MWNFIGLVSLLLVSLRLEQYDKEQMIKEETDYTAEDYVSSCYMRSFTSQVDKLRFRRKYDLVALEQGKRIYGVNLELRERSYDAGLTTLWIPNEWEAFEGD